MGKIVPKLGTMQVPPPKPRERRKLTEYSVAVLVRFATLRKS